MMWFMIYLESNLWFYVRRFVFDLNEPKPNYSFCSSIFASTTTCHIGLHNRPPHCHTNYLTHTHTHAVAHSCADSIVMVRAVRKLAAMDFHSVFLASHSQWKPNIRPLSSSSSPSLLSFMKQNVWKTKHALVSRIYAFLSELRRSRSLFGCSCTRLAVAVRMRTSAAGSRRLVDHQTEWANKFVSMQTTITQ